MFIKIRNPFRNPVKSKNININYYYYYYMGVQEGSAPPYFGLHRAPAKMHRGKIQNGWLHRAPANMHRGK